MGNEKLFPKETAKESERLEGFVRNRQIAIPPVRGPPRRRSAAKRNRSAYYQLLNDIRHTGDWEAWLRFFLEGVREVAEGAVATARSASETIRDDRSRIGRQGRRAGSALRVHQALVERPVGRIGGLAARTGLSAPTVAAALRLLEKLDIVREITGRQRGKVFRYERYLAVLREGTEEPPG